MLLKTTRIILQPIIFLCYVVATVCLAILTCIGYALTWLYKHAGWPDGLTAWNCWAFVIAKWLEAGPRKTYITINVSPHGPIPHVRFAKSIDGLQVSEFIPIKPKRGWKAILDSVKFKGRVREGEGEEKK